MRKKGPKENLSDPVGCKRPKTDQQLAAKGRSIHAVVATAYDFSNMDTITDVGGGFGGLLIQILKANPNLKGILVDLPETVAQLDQIIRLSLPPAKPFLLIGWDCFELLEGYEKGSSPNH